MDRPDSVFNRAVAVRVSELHSPLHALAISRKLASKFGPIELIKTKRDPAMRSRLQPLFHCTFKSANVLDAIPETGTLVSLSIVPSLHRPGGIGLSEIEQWRKEELVGPMSTVMPLVEQRVSIRPHNYRHHHWRPAIAFVPAQERAMIAEQVMAFQGFGSGPNPYLSELKAKWKGRLDRRRDQSRQPSLQPTPAEAALPEGPQATLSDPFVLPQRVSPLLAAVSASSQVEPTQEPVESAQPAPPVTPQKKEALNKARKRLLTQAQRVAALPPRPKQQPALVPVVTKPIPPKPQRMRTSNWEPERVQSARARAAERKQPQSLSERVWSFFGLK